MAKIITTPTALGIPTFLRDLDNACVAFSIVRMFPFLDPNVVEKEFKNLNGEDKGLSDESTDELLNRLGVSKYLESDDFSMLAHRFQPTLKEIRAEGRRCLVSVPKHMIFIQEDGEILDSGDPLSENTPVDCVRRVKPSMRAKLKERIASWRKRMDKRFQGLAKKEKNLMRQTQARLNAGKLSRADKKKLLSQARFHEGSIEWLRIDLEECINREGF